MPTLLIAECRQEVSSFNPVPSHYTDFDVLAGDALIDYHRRVRDEVGGALSVFDLQPDLRLVPALSARAIISGGTLAAALVDRLTHRGHVIEFVGESIRFKQRMKKARTATV